MQQSPFYLDPSRWFETSFGICKFLDAELGWCPIWWSPTWGGFLPVLEDLTNLIFAYREGTITISAWNQAPFESMIGLKLRSHLPDVPVLSVSFVTPSFGEENLASGAKLRRRWQAGLQKTANVSVDGFFHPGLRNHFQDPSSNRSPTGPSPHRLLCSTASKIGSR